MGTVFRSSTIIFLWLLAAGIVLLPACYSVDFKKVDQQNLRDQFHVPKNVPFVAFDSHPKEAGWFGREGLRIHGVLQFSQEQFGHYLAGLDDPKIWKPVKFHHYSPNMAQSHTDSAFKWLSLPIHSWAERYLKHWEHLPEVKAIRNGRYYCAVLMGKRGEGSTDGRGGNYPKWNWRMKHCSEIDSAAHPVITTFGALDLEARKLYVFIGFSG